VCYTDKTREREPALIIARSAPRRVVRSGARTRPPKGGKQYNYHRRLRAARARRHSEGARAERSAKMTSTKAQCELSAVMLHQRTPLVSALKELHQRPPLVTTLLRLTRADLDRFRLRHCCRLHCLSHR